MVKLTHAGAHFAVRGLQAIPAGDKQAGLHRAVLGAQALPLCRAG